MLSSGREIYEKDKKTKKREGKKAKRGKDRDGIKVKDDGTKEEEVKEPKDYEVFLDIKRSYENSLAKMDTLVKKL